MAAVRHPLEIKRLIRLILMQDRKFVVFFSLERINLIRFLLPCDSARCMRMYMYLFLFIFAVLSFWLLCHSWVISCLKMFSPFS